MSTLTPTSRIPYSNSSRRKGKLAEFNGVFRAAARRVRAERTLSFAVASLPIPIVLAICWVLFVRFTLLELPEWPSLVPFAAWALALLFVMVRTRVTTGQAARYLDRALGLDERLATYVEMVSRLQVSPRSSIRSSYLQDLGANTLKMVKTSMNRLPRVAVRAGRRRTLAMPISAAILAFALFVPTPLDAVRLERYRLAQTVASQVERIANLRADFISRPQVSDNVRAALLAELDRLEAALKTPGLDRASLLAALADTQERLRELSPDLSSDFDSLIRAAQLVQEAVARSSSWSQATSKERTELGRAADASDFLAAFLLSEEQSENLLTQFATFGVVAAAQRFESAAGLAGQRDAELAKLLQETSTLFVAERFTPAARQLKLVAEQFRKNEGKHQAAEAIEHALSSLDDGKQSIAQAGESKPKKAQVGFRRGAVGAQTGGGQQPVAGTTPTAGNTGENGPGAPEGSPQPLGSSPRIGNNMPALGGSDSGPGNQLDKQGDSSGQSGDGQSGGTQKSGEAGSQPGSQGGSSQPIQSDGQLSGPISAPGSNVTGGITRVENPEGAGVSGGDKPGPQTPGKGSDTVSVPVQGATGVGQTGGQGPQPTPGGPTQGSEESGGVGTGNPSGAFGSTGSGSLATIRTPYTEVIGQYLQRAADALDRIYIPQDAKVYVRDYFTILGR
ncbi:MAG TPA: hypothetical protein VJ183_12715 [Chloroflexia bacterium]|nr:hypothetical protein [Chloroflexia bacterium]